MSAAPVATTSYATAESAGRLAAPPTPFIGRERESATVVALLRRPEIRLVTLTGPGGIGKTRLALRVIELVGANFPDGVIPVALAPLRDHALVLPTIAEAAGAREDPERTALEVLVDTLVGRRFLLLLDNCEHVIAAARDLARLLVACSDLTIFATSRESLRITGEREVAVPPLTVRREASGVGGGVSRLTPRRPSDSSPSAHRRFDPISR
jgi:predicted ATPase